MLIAMLVLWSVEFCLLIELIELINCILLPLGRAVRLGKGQAASAKGKEGTEVEPQQRHKSTAPKKRSRPPRRRVLLSQEGPSLTHRDRLLQHDMPSQIPQPGIGGLWHNQTRQQAPGLFPSSRTACQAYTFSQLHWVDIYPSKAVYVPLNLANLVRNPTGWWKSQG